MQTRLNVLRGGRGNQNWIVTARLVKSITQASACETVQSFPRFFLKTVAHLKTLLL